MVARPRVLGGSRIKKLYKAHVYAGLFVGIHFLVFSLTGLALLFRDEIQGADSHVSWVQGAALAERYQAALDQVSKDFPRDRPLAVFPDERDPGMLNFRLGLDGATKLRGARKVPVGEVQAPKAAEPVFEWLLTLHRELFLGSIGKLYVGVVGLAYAFMLVSGLVIYFRFMRGRSWRDLTRSTRLVDFHKLTGIVTFAWGLLVGMTGVFLAFNGLLIKAFQAQSLEHLAQKYSADPTEIATASLSRVVQSALDAIPGSIPSYVSFPGSEYGIAGHFLVLVNGSGTFDRYLSELVVIDARTGAFAEIVPLPVYLKATLISAPLHFGNFGGIGLKLLWALFALGSLAVVLLGIVSFWRKRMRPRARAKHPASKPMHVEATRHATACLLNSFLKEWPDARVGTDSVEIPLDAVGREVLIAPLRKYSRLGRHQYQDTFFRKQGTQLTQLEFEQVVSALSQAVETRFDSDPARRARFEGRVFSSRRMVQLTLEQRSDQIRELALEYRQAEQGLVVGHCFHPTPKSRDEFTDEDLHRYSPELGGEFRLQWLLADPQIVFRREAQVFAGRAWTRELVRQELSQELREGWVALPMHPWQLKVLESNPVVRDYVDAGKLVRLGEASKRWHATSSLRTVYREDAPFMLKFSMSVKITNSVRHLLTREVDRGLQLTDVLATPTGKRFQAENPQFHVLGEPAYLALKDASGEPLCESIVVCRDNPFQGAGAQGKAVLATLAQDPLLTDSGYIQSLIETHADPAIPRGEAARRWFAAYLRAVVRPLVLAQADYGIILGAHQQNLVLDIKDGFPVGAYFRDCQGTGYSELGYSLFAGQVPSITRQNGNVVSREMGNYLFSYYLILNSTFGVISALAQRDWISEDALLADLRALLVDLRARGVRDSTCLDYLLDEERLMHKGNFLCSLRGINENTSANPLAIYTPILNPLYERLAHA